MEALVIDYFFRKAGRPCPFWLTKEENSNIPSILAGNRLIFVNRGNPDSSTIKQVYKELKKPKGAIATSLEGTRFGNSVDRSDLLTLGNFKTGLVRIASNAGIPILPVIVIGTEKVLPNLDQIYKDKKISGALKEIQLARKTPQEIQLRFLPIYTDHLEERAGINRDKADYHAIQIGKLLIKEILKIQPDYPLGPHKNL
jgi:1-acyl-sn-glycerol-3-phosphate acyltransferase